MPTISLCVGGANLTKEQIKQFLLTAKVMQSKYANRGITNTWWLTLSGGTITHDASFQSVDEPPWRADSDIVSHA